MDGTLVPPQPVRRLSEILRSLDAGAAERVYVGGIIDTLGDRSFAPLMVVFAAPNVVLYVPGSSAITALPLMVLALQLILGRPRVWLPRFITDRSIERSTFSRIVAATVPWVERIERLAKPRAWPASSQLAERTIGVATLLLAILLFLPIPFVNSVEALAVIALALGFSERDGYWLVGGLLLTLLSTVLVAGILYAGVLTAVNFVFR